MSENNTNLMEKGNFLIPEVIEGSFSNDDLAEDMAGLNLNFLRVKIPAGGALQFELPGDDPEDPEYAKTIEGVILYNHSANALWSEDSEGDDDAAPLCSSVDGINGFGEPGGACYSCSNNLWGSGEGGKGKACKNMRNLYLLRSGEFMPILLSMPPTSIKPFTDFYNMAFASRHRAAYGSVVQIGLTRKENGNNIYSIANFKKLFDFSGEELAQVQRYAANFKEQIRLIIQQRASGSANASAEYDDEFLPVDSDGFAVSSPDGIIDGDRERIPA